MSGEDSDLVLKKLAEADSIIDKMAKVAKDMDCDCGAPSDCSDQSYQTPGCAKHELEAAIQEWKSGR